METFNELKNNNNKNSDNIIFRGAIKKEEINKKEESESISKTNYFSPSPGRKFISIFIYLPFIINLVFAFSKGIYSILYIIMIDFLVGFVLRSVLFKGDAGLIYELFFVLLDYTKTAKYRIPITIIFVFITKLILEKLQ